MAPPHISIVEDDASLRDALVALFASVGWTSSGHGSVEDFIHSPDVDNSDCVITDIQLPGLSGVELALRLRQSPRPSPVIIITARSEQALLQRAALSGALCVLIKPFSVDDLLACVEKALADRPG